MTHPNSLNNLVPYNKGYDPRRNNEGRPKGTTLRHQFGKEMFEKHRDDWEQLYENIIRKALWGSPVHEKMILPYGVTPAVTDITANNSEDDVVEVINPNSFLGQFMNHLSGILPREDFMQVVEIFRKRAQAESQKTSEEPTPESMDEQA